MGLDHVASLLGLRLNIKGEHLPRKLICPKVAEVWSWTEEVMDASSFPSSVQEGHPPLAENAGSTSAAGAEGYVTSVAALYERGGLFCS